MRESVLIRGRLRRDYEDVLHRGEWKSSLEEKKNLEDRGDKEDTRRLRLQCRHQMQIRGGGGGNPDCARCARISTYCRPKISVPLQDQMNKIKLMIAKGGRAQSRNEHRIEYVHRC